MSGGTRHPSRFRPTTTATPENLRESLVSPRNCCIVITNQKVIFRGKTFGDSSNPHFRGSYSRGEDGSSIFVTGICHDMDREPEIRRERALLGIGVVAKIGNDDQVSILKIQAELVSPATSLEKKKPAQDLSLCCVNI